MGNEQHDRPNRAEDSAKCPACGWRMDPQAYRCPKCFIYFCSRCRARVQEREPQFQCADQSCSCYGKLVCSACTVVVQEFKDVTRTEYDEVIDEPEHIKKEEVDNPNLGCGCLMLFLAFGATGLLVDTYGKAVAIAYFIFVILLSVGWIYFFSVRKVKVVVPATTKKVARQVTKKKLSAEHHRCIQCEHPLKRLR